MRISEFVLDWITDTALFEMAYERKYVVSTIRNKQSGMASHLVKFLAFDSSAKSHWMDELHEYFSSIDDLTLKPNCKKLSGDKYYALLWDEPLNNGIDHVTKMIAKMKAGPYESCGRTSLSDVEVYAACEKTLHAISYDIANNKFISFSDYVA